MQIFTIKSLQIFTEAFCCFVFLTPLHVKFSELVKCYCLLVFDSLRSLSTFDGLFWFVQFFIAVCKGSPHPWILWSKGIVTKEIFSLTLLELLEHNNARQNRIFSSVHKPVRAHTRPWNLHHLYQQLFCSFQWLRLNFSSQGIHDPLMSMLIGMSCQVWLPFRSIWLLCDDHLEDCNNCLLYSTIQVDIYHYWRHWWKLI